MKITTISKGATADERRELFDALALSLGLKQEFIEYLIDNGFLEAPASLKHHGAYEGALFDHSFAVMKTLVELTDSLELFWFRPQSPIIVGLFHDLCKIDDYKRSANGVWEWNQYPITRGHGGKSAFMLQKYLELTEEESACICYHMGAFTEKSEWRDYGEAVERFPNVLFTHTADMYAARVLEV